MINMLNEIAELLKPYMPMILDIFRYGYYGAQSAFLGYLKSEDLANGIRVIFTKAFWAKFDPIKATKTVLLGMFLGFLTRGAIYLPTEVTQSPDWLAFSALMNSAIVLGVEALVKVLFRRTPLMWVWNGIKDTAVAFLEKVTA